jgi:hypothetical protein
MSISPVGSVSRANLVQQTQAVRPANDGDADDKTVAPVANAAQSSPAANDGDADDALGTAQSRLSGPSQAALLLLQSGN